MKYRLVYALISLVLILGSIFSLLFWGLKLDIDFTGGSLMEVRFQQDVSQIDLAQLRGLLEEEYQLDSIQRSGDDQLILRSGPISAEEQQAVVALLEQEYDQVEMSRFESVGPVLGRELITKTAVAVVIVALVIILYVSSQFKQLKFGVSGVLAMFHDSLILIGSFSVLGHFYGIEVDVLFVTALLTTLSFSIHDTIVIYNRIRELMAQERSLELIKIADIAVTETLVRSINNSITIFITLLALVFLGGETIRPFALALLIGAVLGTYSSTFTAVPLLHYWDQAAAKIKAYRKLKKRRRR